MLLERTILAELYMTFIQRFHLWMYGNRQEYASNFVRLNGVLHCRMFALSRGVSLKLGF